MNQHDYCTYSVHQSVSLSLWDVLRQELPNLASFTFCKTSLYRLSSLQGDESQRWSVVLLGRRTCCLAGIEIPCGQWTRETERERETMSFAHWTSSIWTKKETTCRKDEIPLYPSLPLFLPNKHLEENAVIHDHIPASGFVDFLTCVVADGVQPLKVLVAMVTPAIYTCAGGVAVDQGKVLTGWVEPSTVGQ